jgi:hypothetical protein
MTMTKKKEQEWPTKGGSYTRDKSTGKLSPVKTKPEEKES